MRVALYPEAAEFAASRAQERRFEPGKPEDRRENEYAGWRAAAARVLVKRPQAREEET